MEAYLCALEKELLLRAGEAGGAPLYSLFLGGGTPSTLPEGSILRIMRTIRSAYRIDRSAEITMEVNPGTVTEAKAAEWMEAGINRISMGVQSFDDDLLKKLGRIHSSEDVEHSFRILEKAGFTNLSFDLMFGLPGQSPQTLQETLEKALSYPIRHLSLYSLIVEEGTPFFRMEEEGKLDLPDEEAEREMYHRSVRFLEDHGFYQYELSNFARPGYESIHNTGYWQRRPYIGAGLGASSLIGEERFHQSRELDRYLKDPAKHEDREVLSLKDQMSETLFLGLRQTKGISEDEFADRFGCRIEDAFPGVIEKHLQEGLLVREGGRLYLSAFGMDVSNQVFVDFI